MKKYQLNMNGCFEINNMTIPHNPSNRHYRQMMAEVEAGEAEILPCVAPPTPPSQLRDEALANMVHDFGDGRVIQCRDPAFAEDESRMRNAIEKMTRDGTTSMTWFMADNTSAQVTPAELQESIESGQDQAAVIWDTFFAAMES